MASPAALLLYAFIAVAGLILLTARFKVSAFIALTLASIFLGCCAGLAPAAALKAFQDGLASVLGSIAMIIALGTVLGKILAESGGAEIIASRILEFFGPKRLGAAFFLIGLVVGLPVFFAVGIVLLIPILRSATAAIERPLPVGLCMVAGLSAAHGIIPPHPGPLAAIGQLNADLGKTLLLSLPVAAVSGAMAGPLMVRWLPSFRTDENKSGAPPRANKTPPGFAITLWTILLPIFLIACATLPATLFPKRIYPLVQLVGHPVSALLIGVFFAYLTIGRRFSNAELLRYSEESLGPIAIPLLVIGAGAGFSRVLIESGVGKVVSDLAVHWHLRAVPMGFVLAALVRIATGSATVAITTSAGLVKPIADALPGTNLELVVLAMGAGSLILSHVNDGGFWLVKEYLNLSVPQALKTWTVLETVLSILAFACVLLLDVII